MENTAENSNNEQLTPATIPVYVEDWDRLAQGVRRGPVDDEQCASFVFICRTVSHLNSLATIEWDVIAYYLGTCCYRGGVHLRTVFAQPPSPLDATKPAYAYDNPALNYGLWGKVRDAKAAIIGRAQNDAATYPYTAAQVAEILGISDDRVRRLAVSRNVGRKLGPRMWAFTAADIEAMRDRKTGRPPRERDEEH